jgi:hypothetical protein
MACYKQTRLILQSHRHLSFSSLVFSGGPFRWQGEAARHRTSYPDEHTYHAFSPGILSILSGSTVLRLCLMSLVLFFIFANAGIDDVRGFNDSAWKVISKLFLRKTR